MPSCTPTVPNGAMAWYGERGRWGQTSCLLQSSERAAPGRLPPSLRWLRGMRARVPTSARFSICLSIIFLPFSSWAGSIFFSLLCFSVSNYVYIRTTEPNRRSAGRGGAARRRDGDRPLPPLFPYRSLDCLDAR